MPSLTLNNALIRPFQGILERLTHRRPLPPNIRAAEQYVPGWRGDPDVKVLTFERTDRPQGSPAILWLHGGGFIASSASAETNDYVRIAQELNILVVSVQYRLAPDYPFPHPLDDCYAALRWLHDQADTLGIDTSRIALGGESAGGGLCAALAQRALDAGDVKSAFQLLAYPMLDDRTTLKIDHAGRGELLWTPGSNRFAWASYLGHTPTEVEERPYAVPSRREDLSGLPPAWIGVGTLDLFYEEDVAYARKLQAADVACELVVVKGGYHMFELMAEDAPESVDFTNQKIDALRRGLGLDRPFNPYMKRS